MQALKSVIVQLEKYSHGTITLGIAYDIILYSNYDNIIGRLLIS